MRRQDLPADIARWLDADPADSGGLRQLRQLPVGARPTCWPGWSHALRALPVRVALAIGSADRAVVGDLPADWLVREFLPQVALVERSALVITHGGNNSVTESLTAGVPMLVLPFSTDQFAGAAAIENAGLGVALDPQRAPRPRTSAPP